MGGHIHMDSTMVGGEIKSEDEWGAGFQIVCKSDMGMWDMQGFKFVFH